MMSDLFPDCKLHFMEQRTEEWFEVRRGILTASAFGPWLINKTKIAETAREKAICKMIAEKAHCWMVPTFENELMRRGTAYEPEAIKHFQEVTGLKVKNVGFAKSKTGSFGCSPDGLIDGLSAGVESKVPAPEQHLVYRRANELPEEYRFQVHGSMAVTGAKQWWFQSWNPGLAPLIILVERDEFTETLKAALELFSNDLKVAWAEEKKAQEDYRNGKVHHSPPKPKPQPVKPTKDANEDDLINEILIMCEEHNITKKELEGLLSIKYKSPTTLTDLTLKALEKLADHETFKKLVSL